MLSKKFNPFVSKIVYATLLYVLIFWDNKSDNQLIDYFNLLIFFSFYLGTGVFGYISNDISDEKIDKEVGKTNVTTHLSFSVKIFLLCSFALIGFLPISVYSPQTIPWVIGEFILLIIYAFPPLRLKEKGFLGVITDSLYAYLFPAIILLTYLDSIGLVDIFFWFFIPVFSFLVGIRNILHHQIEDYDNDMLTNTKTFATRYPLLSKKIQNFSTLVAIFSWLLALIFVQINPFSNVVSVFFLVIGLIYFLKLIFYFLYKDEKFIASAPEFDFIFYGLIVEFVFLLIEQKFSYCFIVFFLFLPIFRPKIAGLLFQAIILCKNIYFMTRRILSFIINYTLYYSFLLVGINLKERAKNRKKSITTKHSENIIQPIDFQEKNVHGLWIGKELSLMEMLTVKSFIENGYVFHIWTYDRLINDLPEGCVVCDANEILPAEKVFRYKYSSQFGTGKGSYAGFSDIFRYKLLYEKGGWWVDMDVTCLKPFDVPAPYFFREHHDLPLVGNIMKAPKGSAFMFKCYEDAVREVDENNRDWHRPITILVENVFKFELQKYIVRDVSNTDEWHKIKPFVYSNKLPVPENWYFVHWCNEVWRTNNFDKNAPFYASFYGQLLMKYQLIPTLPQEEWKRKDRKLRVRLTVERFLDFI